MPAVSKDQALDLLAGAVQGLSDPLEVREVYRELFPKGNGPKDAADKAPQLLIERMVHHIRGGLGIDEIVDLWSLLLPKCRNVWYDEVDEKICYSEQAESTYAD